MADGCVSASCQRLCLLVDGEGGLRQCFLSALEQVSHNVCALNFAEQSIGSDFALVEENMQSCTSMLHAQAQKCEEIAAAEAKAKNEAEKESSGGQGVCSSLGETITPNPTTASADAPKTNAVNVLQDHEEQGRIREAAAAGQERQASFAQNKQEEEEENNAICNEARLTIDNCWTIYNDIPRKGCPPVQRVEKNHQVVYVVPTQSYVRGKPEAQVPLLQMQGLEVLHWATEKDILVIGVGHDPVVIPSLMTMLKSVTDVVNKFRWHPLVPIVQPRPKCGKTGRALHEYVECVLIGYGSQHKPIVPSFLMVRRAFPMRRLRPKHCPKCIKRGQPSGIIADGCDEVCEIHTWAQGRFTSRLPGNPPRKQREAKQKSDIDVFEFWWASESIRAISRSASACLRCRLGHCATTRPVQKISARRI